MSTTTKPRGVFGVSKRNVPGVIFRAMAMYDGFTANAATFTSPTIGMVAFLALVTSLSGSQQQAKETKGKATSTVRNTKRDALWTAMEILIEGRAAPEDEDDGIDEAMHRTSRGRSRSHAEVGEARPPLLPVAGEHARGPAALDGTTERRSTRSPLRGPISVPGRDGAHAVLGRRRPRDRRRGRSCCSCRTRRGGAAAWRGHGLAESPRGARTQPLDVNAPMHGSRLRASFTLSDGVHRREMIEALAEGSRSSLRSAIAHAAGGYAAPDFDEAFDE